MLGGIYDALEVKRAIIVESGASKVGVTNATKDVFLDNVATINSVEDSWSCVNKLADRAMTRKEPAMYIMASRRNGTLYTGVTSDLTRRAWEHRADAMNSLQRSYRQPPGPRQLCITLRMPHGHGGMGENPEEIRAFADHHFLDKPALPRVTAQGTEDGVT